MRSHGRTHCLEECCAEPLAQQRLATLPSSSHGRSRVPTLRGTSLSSLRDEQR